jgi:succinoglycan biosynthesis protein ExoM
MHVAVCCITFRRPEGLRRLLEGLGAQTFAKVPEPRITIVVVDNDATEPMRALVESCRPGFRWTLVYDCEPGRGLSKARNCSLGLVPQDADYVAFIDDDEVPVPIWLDELLHIARICTAPIVQGPLMPAFSPQVPAWVRRGRFFEHGPFEDGAPLAFAAAGNSLIECDVIRRLELRFDERFNFTGGEDQHFFGRAIRAGNRVVTAGKALVYESIPDDRTTLAYLLRRHFRMGNTLTMIARIDEGPVRMLLRVPKGFGRIGLGLAQSVVLAPKGLAGVAAGLCNVAWGVGTLAGLFGVRHREYGQIRRAAGTPPSAEPELRA